MDYPFGDMLKAAFTGPNAAAFGFLNVVLIFAQHWAFISNRWAFAIAAAIGGGLGALGGVIEAQATVGMLPAAILRAAIVAGIIGAGSATLIGLAVVKALAGLGLVPVSEAKQLAEAIRDPLNPTQPGDTTPTLTPPPVVAGKRQP